jgi:ATP-binding cassette, subfamily B, bacterial PglK
LAHITKLFFFLSLKEKKQGVKILALILIMAILDTVGLASILPFISVLANPDIIETNDFFIKIYEFSNYENKNQFLIFLGIMVFVLLVISLSVKALTTHVQLRFVMMCEYSIGRRLLKGYLNQPYSWFLTRHSSELGKNILSEVSNVIYFSLMPMMTLISQGIVCMAMVILLLMIDPLLAISTGLFFGIIYALIFKFANKFLAAIGKERIEADQDRFKAVIDSFSAVKDVKLGSHEKVYIQAFSTPAQIYARHQASASLIAVLPKFAIEGLAFGGILLIILYSMITTDSLAQTLPITALYAFTGYRLMPAFQQIYGSLTNIRFNKEALDQLHKQFYETKKNKVIMSNKTLTLDNLIQIQNVKYSYLDPNKPALKGITLEIPSGSSIGFIGRTGSGKTTLVDVLLGLLEPQEGSIIVDGEEIDASNRKSFQRSIGYVPQEVVLIDDTISANIAFGVSLADINHDAVVFASKIANLHEFIINDLSEGYNTKVGERGVRLSGGQRQRIGIARALYNKPKMLVLDEATSALDNLTEKAVMEAIAGISDKLTIITIAHRLSTVRNCDNIYILQNGEFEAQGKYEELLASNEIFQQMLKFDVDQK